MTCKSLGALFSHRPTLMMSSFSDWHSTRAETSRTRPVTSMAMTLTGMATVRPVKMAVLIISVSCREARGVGALLHACLQGHVCHLLPRFLAAPTPQISISLGKWHMCAQACLCQALGSSSDDQYRGTAEEGFPASKEHPFP